MFQMTSRVNLTGLPLPFLPVAGGGGGPPTPLDCDRLGRMLRGEQPADNSDLDLLLGPPASNDSEFALPLDLASLFDGLGAPPGPPGAVGGGTGGVVGNGSGGLGGCSLSDIGPFTVNPNSGEFDVLKEWPFALLVILLYILVIFLGTVGNSLVVLTVIRTRKLWNATNIFIVNLAFSDVFVCVFDLPISAYYQITDDWIFGPALCKVIPVCFAVIVYASTLTLTMISIDRYLLIVLPLKNKMTVKLAMLLVLGIAAVSIAVASPIAMYSKYVVIDDQVLGLHRRYCLEEWPTPSARFLYTITTLVLQFFLPLILIAILYCQIFKKVRSRVKTKNSRKTKTTKMLVAVVSVFAVTWTPFHLYAVITELHYDAVKGKYYKFLDALLRLFAMLSSCLNPFLYGWLNDNYRNAFLALIRRTPAANTMIHREDSDENSRRSVANGSQSPGRRAMRTVVVNGKVSLATENETFMLKTLTTSPGESHEVHNNNLTNSGRSPLLPKHSPV